MVFVSHDQAPELVDPGEGALHDPSMLPEATAALDAASGDARDDAAGAQVAPTPGIVVALVGMQLVRPLARTAAPLAQRRDGVNHRVQDLAVVNVGPGQNDGERDAGAIDHEVALCAWLAAVGRVRADRVAPLLAATEEESTAARVQSVWPARLRRSSMWRWIRSQRPASCQARSRRQHVMPEQPATSKGSRSHGIAVDSTNRCRSGLRAPQPEAVRPSGEEGRAEPAERSPPTAHQKGASWPCREALSNMVNKRFC